MGRIVPSDITRLALAGARGPELETLRVLRDRLPSSFTVFHGVHWSREYRGYTVYGEIDFVIVNAAGRVLVVEQKNGPLVEAEGALFKVYGPDEAKSVGDQVRRGLEGVREKFRRLHHGNLALDYLVYCPEHTVVKLNAAALDPSRVVDAARRDTLPDVIVETLGAPDAGDPAWRESVEAFFRQTFEVAVDVHGHITAQERNFTRLGGDLARLLRNIEMDPLRLRVYGTAGCGKTLIAREFYDAAVRRGRRPLLVCFNRPLRERLRAVVPPGGEVHTFHGLCDAFLASCGVRLDFQKMKSDPGFWPRAFDEITARTVSDAWTFDTLIVDEGQDFAPEWWQIVRLFLRDEPDVLWLEDPDQNVYGQSAVSLPGFVGFRSRVNVRTPERIARFIRATLPFDFECGNDLPGMPVGVTAYDDMEEQPRRLAALVDRLLRDGFRYEDIVVLTPLGVGKSLIGTRKRVGRHVLRTFTGTYDLFGNQEMSPGRLAFETIGRFKGQQAPAVILADVDPSSRDLVRQQRQLFCGMTRATVRLELMVRSGNPRTAPFLAAVQSS